MSVQSHCHVETGAKAEPVLRRHTGRTEYPLSLNQRHMWFQCQLDPESSLWNLGAKMSVRGPLDVPVFVQALQIMVDRHEILRTVFVLAGDAPVQRVLDHVTVECPVRDLPGNLSPRKIDDMAWERITRVADPVYELSTGPLFRTELLRAGEDQYYFIFGFHHLLLDAFYSGQFMRELISTYDLLRRGGPGPEMPSMQYGDFCVWQDERWNQGLMAGTADFWREQLHEPLPELQFPADPSVPFPRIVKSQVSFNLNAGIVKKMRDIGRQSRTTLFRVVLAAFTLFLSRFSDSDELLVDIDFSTRPREMGHTIGFFANLLPVRLRARAEDTFIDLVRAVDSQLRDVNANREFPVRQLTRKLKGRRSSIQPLSPVVVTQLGELDWSLGGLHLTGTIYVTASIHDLWLGVLERADDLEIIFAYPDELFDHERLREWAASVERLLERVIAAPDEPLALLMEFAEGPDITAGRAAAGSAFGGDEHMEEVTVHREREVHRG
jgi:surfactin family lipopeptide synthetase A